jgi:hypothetical protein
MMTLRTKCGPGINVSRDPTFTADQTYEISLGHEYFEFSEYVSNVPACSSFTYEIWSGTSDNLPPTDLKISPIQPELISGVYRVYP